MQEKFLEYNLSLDSYLLEQRIVFLTGTIDSQIESVIRQVLYLNSENEQKPIHLYIMSQGGSYISMMTLYDVMQTISSPVYTYGIGFVFSAAVLICAAGEQRFALPHSTFLIHELSLNSQGDQVIRLSENRLIQKISEREQKTFSELLASLTKQSVKKILSDMKKEKLMTALEAQQYGLIDKILSKASVKYKVPIGGNDGRE